MAKTCVLPAQVGIHTSDAQLRGSFPWARLEDTFWYLICENTFLDTLSTRTVAIVRTRTQDKYAFIKTSCTTQKHLKKSFRPQTSVEGGEGEQETQEVTRLLFSASTLYIFFLFFFFIDLEYPSQAFKRFTDPHYLALAGSLSRFPFRCVPGSVQVFARSSQRNPSAEKAGGEVE